MNPNKALWEKGDFTCIAETMLEGGEALVDKFGIRWGRGLRVYRVEDGVSGMAPLDCPSRIASSTPHEVA